jgi:hypothetical protein
VKLDAMGQEKASINVGSNGPIDAMSICHDL